MPLELAVDVAQLPDPPRQVQDGHLLGVRDVEVLVDRLLRLEGGDDAAGDVPDVGERACLAPVAEELHRALAAEHLLGEVGDDVGIADVLAGVLVDAVGVEGPADREGQPELVGEGVAVPLAAELAEPVGRDRRGISARSDSFDGKLVALSKTIELET